MDKAIDGVPIKKRVIRLILHNQMDKVIRKRANTVPPFIDKEFLLIIFLIFY